MSKPIDTFAEYVTGDLLAHIPNITSHKMFGGYGLYQDRRIFAIIVEDGALCFKADAALAETYAAAGAEQFIYHGHKNKKPTPMPYWQAPQDILEDKDTLTDWVYQSAALSEPK
jgi:DNA transformation protein